METEKPSESSGVEQTLEQAVSRETAVHGGRWAAQFGGYFSDPRVAEPFLEIIEQAVRETRPDALVDLGGGTGFVLRELIRRKNIPDNLALYDLDLSERQLAALSDTHIRPLNGSFLEFTRDSVATDSQRLMLITRSTLHYAGMMGQEAVLRHIREQMKPGERFVHQTAASANPETALLTDELLERMHSDKWMAPLSSLVALSEKAGFKVIRVADAPDLPLDEPTLADRYGIRPDEMAGIRATLNSGYSDSPFWRMTPNGFVILQEYKILVCEAE